MTEQNTPSTAPALDPEMAAELAELSREAGAEPPPPGSPEAVAAEEAASRPTVDLAGEIAGLLLTVSAVLKPALPSLAAIYTAENCQAAGAAVAAVCQKHGWLQGGIVGGFGEELAALAVLGPMAVSTYSGVKSDLAAAKRAAPSLTQPAPTGGASLVDSVAAPLGA